MSWGNLREGLLADLALESPEALAAKVQYDDVEHTRAALARTVPPNDELMAAMLRHYLTVPALYFVERTTTAAA